MKFTKRYLPFLLCICLAAGSMAGCSSSKAKSTKETSAGEKQTKELSFWFCDSELTPYFEKAGRAYEEKTGVKINIRCVDSVEYTEQINEASLKKKGPDVYLLSSENLKKAKLAGLTEKNRYEKFYTEENYPAAALQAASWEEELTGYPFSYDVSFLLYRKDVFKNAPSTFAELNKAGNAGKKAKKEKSALLRWDLTDVFYNFAFVGSRVVMEEDEGEGAGRVSVNTEELTECLKAYQSMSKQYPMELNKTTDDENTAAFLGGSLYSMLAKSSSLRKVTAAQLNGTGKVSYGIAKIPDISETMKTSPLSITMLAEVNGLSQKKKEAARFAKFLTYEEAENLYRETGRFPARKDVYSAETDLGKVMEAYESSVPVPRMTDFGSYWMEIQTSFERIWKGADIKKEITRIQTLLEKNTNSSD